MSSSTAVVPAAHAPGGVLLARRLAAGFAVASGLRPEQGIGTFFIWALSAALSRHLHARVRVPEAAEVTN